MDKIWDRNRWNRPLWVGWKNKWPRRTDKKSKKNPTYIPFIRRSRSDDKL